MCLLQCTNVFCQNENKTLIYLENILKNKQIPFKVAIITNHLYYMHPFLTRKGELKRKEKKREKERGYTNKK